MISSRRMVVSVEIKSIAEVLMEKINAGRDKADSTNRWQRIWIGSISASCLLISILCLACGGGGGRITGATGSPPPPPAPAISSFMVSQNPIVEGGSAALTAVFSGGTATLDNGIGPISSGVAISIAPINDTTYTLTVINSHGTSVTRSLPVQVVAPQVGALSTVGIFAQSRVFTGEASCLASIPDQGTSAITWDLQTVTATGSITSATNSDLLAYGAGDSPGTYQLNARIQSPSGETTTLTKTLNIVGNTFLDRPQDMIPRTAATATTLIDGRILVTGGIGSDQRVRSDAEIYDPYSNTWDQAGNMTTARYAHTATMLQNGKVLVVGGIGADGLSISAAEIFDPSTDGWTLLEPALTSLQGHTATLLQNGKVLVSGGNSGGVSAELYDPFINRWFVAGQMVDDRRNHTATLLPSGEVMVAGGIKGYPLESVEFYNAKTDTWTSGAPMSVARSSHVAVLLPNGSVLMAGGIDSRSSPQSGSEIYDPATGAWETTGPMLHSHINGAAASLADGSVLVVGGTEDYGDLGGDAEIFDPRSETWKSGGSLATARAYHFAASLPNGEVLVAGGGSNAYFGGAGISCSEFYNPDSRMWTHSGPLAFDRGGHSATLLNDGRILLSDGASIGGSYYSYSEIFDPIQNSWLPPVPQIYGREGQSTALLKDGRVLAAGGVSPFDFGDAGITWTAEIFDPTTDRWSETNQMSTARTAASAVTLPDGRVLVAGGAGGMDQLINPLASCELYDPLTGLWSPTGDMTTPREGHAALLLKSGKVLVIGGTSNITTAELFDPSLGTWSSAGTLQTARGGFSATLLSDGRVLVAGGFEPLNSFLSVAEIYDPATNSWGATGQMLEARAGQSATLLPNGKVLVVGGWTGDPITYSREPLSSGEVYDPVSQQWSSVGSTNVVPGQAALLSNGKVLFAGGTFSGGLTCFFKALD